MSNYPGYRPARSNRGFTDWLAVGLLFGVALSAVGGRAEAEQPKKAFRAGAAAVDITPERLPVSMTGSFWDRQAVQVHDRLHARCLVLDDGSTRVAIVVCDSCLISREIFDRAKQHVERTTGIPARQILMSATHTHSAPTAVPLAQCRPDPEYVQFLVRQIARSVEQAAGQLQPAAVGWAVVQEPGEVFNRRWKMRPGSIAPNPFGETTDRVKMNPAAASADLLEPAGPTDPDLAVLSVQSPDGRPIALLANYALHYVGGVPAGSLSADYFGEFARQITERLPDTDCEPPFVGMLSNGTSGDINNINFRQPAPRSPAFERIRAVAGTLADAVAAAYPTIEHQQWVELAVAERELELGVRRPDADQLERARQTLAQADDGARLTLAEVYAQETVRLAEQAPTVTLKLQTLRIGQLGVAAIPCEAFVEVGLEIKQRSPLTPTFTVGLANGYNGYLPTAEQHALGGYETWRSGWSYLEVEASRKITATILELLQEITPN